MRTLRRRAEATAGAYSALGGVPVWTWNESNDAAASTDEAAWNDEANWDGDAAWTWDDDADKDDEAVWTWNESAWTWNESAAWNDESAWDEAAWNDEASNESDELMAAVQESVDAACVEMANRHAEAADPFHGQWAHGQ